MNQHLPGHDWLAIVRQNGTAEFGKAFALHPTLDASVLSSPCVGIQAIAAFFAATSSGMYETSPSVEGDEAMLKAILPLTDVMAAGHHAAVTAGVRSGGSVAVLECVGTEGTIQMAVNMSRPGGNVGFVGAPHGSGQLPLGRMFFFNIGVRGGAAPARACLPELLKDVLAGQLDPSPILDRTVSLAEVASGYRAMDQRKAIKVMVQS